MEQQRGRPLIDAALLILVALCITLLLGGTAGAQEAPVTTSPSLLIDGTAPSTTEAPTTTAAPMTTSDDGGDSGSASTRLWVAVGLLLVLAVMVAVLTVAYWRMTRPPERPQQAVVDLDALVRAEGRQRR